MQNLVVHAKMQTPNESCNIWQNETCKLRKKNLEARIQYLCNKENPCEAGIQIPSFCIYMLLLLRIPMRDETVL